MADVAAAGARAVAAARAWIGTPYVPGASAQGAGADCLGLLRGVWRTLHGWEPAEAAGPFHRLHAAQGVDERLWRGLAARMETVAAGAALGGDVALIRMRPGMAAEHVGVLAFRPERGATLIHAYSRRGVVESALGPAWRGRVAAAFRFPEDV
ncbi:hypothetical protein [Rubrimonas cliftonensis]|uniref:Putative phage cell wall peptidase, NlpC/P60 family n=1 Tax=Rubrimonas cliftonensis TaxID=89524 RepID=A0A1H3ZGG6_9RHOB|nr:hypothetical protein [Rubrimonas cliftonensis]SEA22843.1 putative phage cell wall peptidase, NlpC/P60 family [Rubrimonas cliftonensis]